MNRSGKHMLRLPCCAVAMVGTLMLAGCASTPDKQRQYPSTVRDWNGIDHVEFLQPFRLGDFSELIVEHFDTSKTVLPPSDENTYKPTVAVLNATDHIVRAELAKKLAGSLQVSGVKPADASPEKTLLLRGTVADIHPGSRAARYWAGFGAGSAWVKIKGEILDAKSQAVLLRFEQQRVGAMGLFGGAYEPMLTDCVVGISRDIGKLLTLAGT